jgi:hypothetical protein
MIIERLFRGAKQMASTRPIDAASRHIPRTLSTEAPAAADTVERGASPRRILSTGRKSGGPPMIVRTSSKELTACVATLTPAIAWPSSHSHASPTKTTSHWITSLRANNLAINSGPIPAGSPSVSANLGFSAILIRSRLHVVPLSANKAGTAFAVLFQVP